MDTQHGVQAIVFDITYEGLVYTSEDSARLQQEFQELGSVRSRPHYAPAAGWGVDIMMVISFIGLAIAGGLIEHITGKFFDSIVKKLQDFYRERRPEGLRFPRSIRLSYDDMDITVLLISEGVLEKLPEILTTIHEHIIAAPSEERPIHEITLPMEYRGGEWRPINLDNPSGIEYQDPYRYWRTAPRDLSGSAYIYDSHERIFIDEYASTAEAIEQDQKNLLSTLLDIPLLDMPLAGAPFIPDRLSYPIVGFLEPEISTNKRLIIDVGRHEEGGYFIDGVEITGISGYDQELSELKCADGSIYYVLHSDVGKIFRG